MEVREVKKITGMPLGEEQKCKGLRLQCLVKEENREQASQDHLSAPSCFQGSLLPDSAPSSHPVLLKQAASQQARQGDILGEVSP